MRWCVLPFVCVLCVSSWAEGPLPFEEWPLHAQEWTNAVLERQGEDRTGALSLSVRGWALHAAGLAVRGGVSDHSRIIRAVESVLAEQYNTPGKPWHGTYKRVAGEPDPPEQGARMFEDFDPNWREFIGLSFILVLDTITDDLDPALVVRIHESIRLACEGAHERATGWHYTNIALMSAYLLSWGGREYNNEEWSTHGEDLARKIFTEFSVNETFWEYNSPTYSGVSFFALGFWRRMPAFPDMQTMGETMNAGLWRDIARYYHAGLKNICGPYDRSSGMDMLEYFAIVGMAIDLATGKRSAMPPIDSTQRAAFELGYLPILAGWETNPPDDAMPHLHTFQSSRSYSRTIIEGSHERVAHAWLHEDWMIGIQTSVRGVRMNSQYHPITAHWRNETGELCWLRLIGDARVNISLDHEEQPAAEVSVRLAGRSPELTFELHAPGVEPEAFTPTSWILPGMTVKLSTEAFEQEFSLDRGTTRIRLVPFGESTEESFSLEFLPDEPISDARE